MGRRSIISLLSRRQGQSVADFQKYWLEVHGPIAAKIPGLKRYEQNHVIDSRQLGISHARGGWNVDGFVELEFEDQASFEAAQNSAQLAAARADEPAFVGAITIMTCEKHVVVARRESDGPVLKRMSILTRKAGITRDEFRHEWLDVHSGYVPSLPRLAGYNQNLVLAQNPRPASIALEIDGVVELWFPDVNSIAAAFSSPAAEVSQGHAKAFLETITTFLVEPHRIV
jgi:uncharacterized protein (TIGR02118 family)